MVELDPKTLLFHRVDAPTTERKVAEDELAALVTEQGRVTHRDVAERFGRRSKNTAGAMLEALPGIDWHEDGTVRGTRYYRIGAGQ